MRAVLVGEAPGPSAQSGRPLLGDRPATSGSRLRSWCGISAADWLRVDRVNLLPIHPGPTWPKTAARAAAQNLCESLLRGRRLVLLGRRVTAAFDVMGVEFGVWFDSPLHVRCIAVPHPSGLNLIYNDAAVRDAAASLLRGILLE